METGRIRIRRSIPESVVVEIIARFKSVCKQWRESSYFRSLFVSLHRNSSSSSSWSLMFPIKYQSPITEAIGFYGCERWDLPKSPASHIIPCQPYPNQDYYYYYVASSNGLVWNEQIYPLTSKIKANAFVGNPVTQECVEITPPPDPVNKPLYFGYASCERCRFKLQGGWAFKQLRSPCPLQGSGFSRSLNLDGTVYVWDKRLDEDDTSPGVLVAYDFYAQKTDNQCRIIPLPGPYNKYVRRCLTTSCGEVIYVEMLYQRLKVWKLKSDNNSDGEWWKLAREEIDMASVGVDVLCFPLGMNPFDTDLIYLWSRQHRCIGKGRLGVMVKVVGA